MTRSRMVLWLVLIAAVAGVTWLYLPALGTGFLNDDFLFLEDARRSSWLESLSTLDPLGNYFRPVSRGLYFESLLPLLGMNPLGFHLFNFGLFLAALILLADLLRVFLPRAGVLVGLLYFATLPMHGVNLRWISCSQDLLALVFVLLAVALYRRGRILPAAAAYLAAVFSKEAALPLPLLLLAWPEPRPVVDMRARARRLLPFGVVIAAWVAVNLMVRANAGTTHRLDFDPLAFVAAWVHEIQALLGLDHPRGIIAAFRAHGPAPLALLALAPVAFLLAGSARDPKSEPAAVTETPAPRTAATFALWWLLGFGFVTGPVVYSWSSYYYTLAAVGAALIVGLLARRIGPAGWLALCGGLLWWHAAGTGVRAFSVDDRRWQWTSHLTAFYFERAAALCDTLGRQLLTLEPSPPPHTRMFFSMLPSYAGFQMGNGAQVRTLYRDSTLASYFHSQFSESTAAGHPCRFYSWDGQRLGRLYGGTSPFFQVGSDLLVLGRTEGALHAFRRGLLAGEYPLDHYYLLGWTEFWLGRRNAAEVAWTRFGARDDSLRWHIRMRLARMALVDQRDTLEAKRYLFAAIHDGIGRPEAHAVLGPLLLRTSPKYGLLELMVAISLKPNDWLARRDLVIGLAMQGLDERARAELAALEQVYPGWQQDTLVRRVRTELERRNRSGLSVVEF